MHSTWLKSYTALLHCDHHLRQRPKVCTPLALMCRMKEEVSNLPGGWTGISERGDALDTSAGFISTSVGTMRALSAYLSGMRILESEKWVAWICDES